MASWIGPDELSSTSIHQSAQFFYLYNNNRGGLWILALTLTRSRAIADSNSVPFHSMHDLIAVPWWSLVMDDFSSSLLTAWYMHVRLWLCCMKNMKRSVAAWTIFKDRGRQIKTKQNKKREKEKNCCWPNLRYRRVAWKLNCTPSLNLCLTLILVCCGATVISFNQCRCYALLWWGAFTVSWRGWREEESREKQSMGAQKETS